MTNKKQTTKKYIKFSLGVVVCAFLLATWGVAQAEHIKPWGVIADGNLRFVVLASLNDEAVLDKETGLIWQRSPTGTGTLIFAVNSCDALKIGGKTGWRLPTVQEMANLLDFEVAAPPLLPAGHPFIGIQGAYWAHTLVDRSGGGTPFVRTVDMDRGDISATNPIEGRNRWCVRGGSRDSFSVVEVQN